MKNRIIICFMLIMMRFAVSCNTGKGRSETVSSYTTVPFADDVVHVEGEPFIIYRTTAVVYPEGNDKMQRNAEFLAEFLGESTGITPSVKASEVAQETAENAIILSTTLNSDNPEAYHIEVNNNAIKIEGASEAAVFYG